MTGRAVRLRITGRVQGVGYRAWAVQRAIALGLRGWVRNRADGSVEALLMGPEHSVTDMIVASRDGPAGARVRDVAEIAAEDDGSTGFCPLATV